MATLLGLLSHYQPYQPRLIFMVEYYEKINRLILVLIEPCHEWDTPLHPVGVAEAL